MGFVYLSLLPVSSPRHRSTVVAPPKLYLPQKAGLPPTVVAGTEEEILPVTVVAGMEEVCLLVAEDLPVAGTGILGIGS